MSKDDIIWLLWGWLAMDLMLMLSSLHYSIRDFKSGELFWGVCWAFAVLLFLYGTIDRYHTINRVRAE